MAKFACLLGASLLAAATATVYFEETFDTDFTGRWVANPSKNGKWTWGSGEWSGDAAEAKGMITSEGMKFYSISAKLPEAFSTKGKDLVVQFTAKYEKNEYSFCGGGYIKLLPSTTDQKTFDGSAPYSVMFGPDRCGTDVSRIHAIFNHEDTNLLKTSDVKLEYADKNEFTHLYTLIVKPDNTYDIQFDGVSKASGKLHDDWAFPAKNIDDPTDLKPADWVDEAKIVDASAVKPADWDNQPAQIPDADAVKPEDWNEEDDGEWEAPQIDNPDFKGEWKAPMIANPAYKGVWKAKQVPNPKYVEDVYPIADIGYVGFELWIVNAGTVFDNIIVTDDIATAKAHADEHWKAITVGEKEAKEAFDAAKKAAEDAAKPPAPAAAEGDEEEEDEEL